MGSSTMKFGEGIIVQGTAGDTAETLIVSGAVAINLEGDGQALKLVGTDLHETRLVFEKPAGNDRVSIEIDSGDNLDIKNYSAYDDINLMVAGGDGVPTTTLVITSNRRVGVGNFGWEGKSGQGGQVPYGTTESFPGRELDVSGSMRVSENVEIMGNELVVSGTISGRYVSDIPGHALIFKNTEHYFLTTDADVNNKVMAPDENIFFSGSIGSKGTTTKGTAVFGGDVVVSGSFYAKQRHMTTSKFNRGNNSAFLVRFDAAGSNLAMSEAGENNLFIAPAHGKLKFIVYRSQYAAGDTAISLWKATTGWNVRGQPQSPASNARGFESQIQEVTLNGLAAETAYKFIFDNAPFQFGDTLGIKINPSNDPAAGNITAVWEMDWTIDG